jgi:hypothetical protein
MKIENKFIGGGGKIENLNRYFKREGCTRIACAAKTETASDATRAASVFLLQQL